MSRNQCELSGGKCINTYIPTDQEFFEWEFIRKIIKLQDLFLLTEVSLQIYLCFKMRHNLTFKNKEVVKFDAVL